MSSQSDVLTMSSNLTICSFSNNAASTAVICTTANASLSWHAFTGHTIGPCLGGSACHYGGLLQATTNESATEPVQLHHHLHIYAGVLQDINKHPALFGPIQP